MTSRTRAAVEAATACESLITRLTVAMETPAVAATSRIEMGDPVLDGSSIGTGVMVGVAGMAEAHSADGRRRKWLGKSPAAGDENGVKRFITIDRGLRRFDRARARIIEPRARQIQVEGGAL